MPTQQAVLLVSVNVVVGAILVGLVVRGRARECWSFVAYLCGLLTCDTLFFALQDRFYNREFWMIKQALYDVLRTATALEMTWRVVRAFPGALRTAQRWAFLLLAGAATVLATGPHRARYGDIFLWQPRVVACTAALFALAALLVAWYHLPVRRLHRAIMGGFAIYSTFFATLLGLLGRWGWGSVALINVVDGLAYLGVTLWWLRAAWAREEEVMPEVEEIRALVEKAA
jgi:hypothetical protein